jgi:hypothetical protein
MSPEDRQRMMESLGMRGGGGRGGRGGGQQAAGQGGGGRGGGRGGRGAAPANVDVEPTPLNAEKIDELFQPTPVRVTPGTVWTWDEANRKLTEIRVTTGLADNQFSQLLTVVSADAKITPGMQLVSSIIVPLTSAQRAAQNPLFGGQRGNFGGMQPGQRGGDNQQQRGGQGGGGNLGFGNMGGGRGGGRGN